MAEIFLYGTDRAGGPDHGWFEGLPAVPATVRGVLYEDDHRRRALLPTADGPPVQGDLVTVPDARIGVLDLLHRGPGLARATVRAAVHLQSRPAFAYVLAEPPGLRSPWRRRDRRGGAS